MEISALPQESSSVADTLLLHNPTQLSGEEQARLFPSTRMCTLVLPQPRAGHVLRSLLSLADWWL